MSEQRSRAPVAHAYAVVVNVPGYLPENDPETAEDLDQARDLLVDAIEETAGARDLDGTMEAAEAREEAMKAESGAVIHLGGYAHCLVQRDGIEVGQDWATNEPILEPHIERGCE